MRLSNAPAKRRKREIEQMLEVRYKVIVKPFSHDFSNKSFTEIADSTTEILKTSTFENFNLTWTNLTESRMESEMKKQSSIENRDELLCGSGYDLDNITCKWKCVGHNCGNNEKCIIDKKGEPLCRCSEIGDFVLYGPNCEIQTEKLALESKYIIAITATVGTVLSIVIMITCFLYYQKRRKVKSMTKAIEVVGDVEDMSQFRPSSIRGSFYTPADMYASVYKSPDKESTHQKEFNNSNDCTNKIYTNTDYMITEGEVLMSPWYQSTEIFNGKEVRNMRESSMEERERERERRERERERERLY
ncbi:Hypothetical predicted protein [Mytilus galloprovincialis]|uniref:EGF-like domain-containing protein n=1 Tax=Mytilus galloprovincialis TaxID=29158 RepID=A0A8B6HGE4_MYTGA|nr:Hypothetical predicted protein [Mytilus galloprovincialis]